MRVRFRADASVAIGNGHVARCVNLARELAKQGHDIAFVCRRLPGDLIDWLAREGFRTTALPFAADDAFDQLRDAEATAAAGACDWLVVDHYELGIAWEERASAQAERLMVIDDLGRAHACDLLLDQNHVNPAHDRYIKTVRDRCTLLLGPEYALLDTQFAAARAGSLRRDRSSLNRLLVFMGGSDAANETCKVLDGIRRSRLRAVTVDVAIGGNNPHRELVERACAALPHATLHVQTDRMAALMAEADCAIGAGGTATWERCALGLPAVVTIMAENQAAIAHAVQASGAQRVLGRCTELSPDDYARALDALDAGALAAMSAAAATICDGKGAERVAAKLIGLAAWSPKPRTEAYA